MPHSQPKKSEDDDESNVQTNDGGEHVDQLMGSNYYNTLRILMAKYVSYFTDSRAKVSLFAIGAFNPTRIDRGAYFPARSLRARFGVRRYYLPQDPVYMVMLFEKNSASFGILPRGVESKISSFTVGDAGPGHPTHLTSEKVKKSVSPDLNDNECTFVSEIIALLTQHGGVGNIDIRCLQARYSVTGSVPSGNWAEVDLFISFQQDGVLREGQFPSACIDDQMTYAYRFTPTPAGGGANVALRMVRLIDPKTMAPYSKGSPGDSYVLDHNVFQGVGISKAVKPMLNALPIGNLIGGKRKYGAGNSSKIARPKPETSLDGAPLMSREGIQRQEVNPANRPSATGDNAVLAAALQNAAQNAAQGSRPGADGN